MLTARDTERDLSGRAQGRRRRLHDQAVLGGRADRTRASGAEAAGARSPCRTGRFCSVGDISIDLVHDTVAVRGRKITLTPSEYKILSLLASDPGVVFSRRQIMERLWESTHIGDEHACEVHVSSLRRKIKAGPSEPQPLVTVRGRGYMLTAPQSRLRPRAA